MDAKKLWRIGLTLCLLWLSVSAAMPAKGEAAGSEITPNRHHPLGTGHTKIASRLSQELQPQLSSTNSEISVYPMPSIYNASSSYTLKANSFPVPVVGYAQYDYAHFSTAGEPVTIEVTVLGQTTIGTYTISPKKLNIPASKNGNKLTFTLTGDEYLIVKIDGKKELVIAADPPETDKPLATGAGIFNVTEAGYQSDRSGTTLTTAAIQRAIDDAAAYPDGQGIVYVPTGVYKVGNLELKSDVALYLEGGAVFHFTGLPADYTKHWHKDSQNRDITWWIYTAPGSTNVKLYGRGTLDGNGKYSTETNNFANNILVPIGVSHFTFDGLIIRDSGSWAVTPARSDHLTFTNMKLFNRLDMGENDGIDINESQEVLVRHAIGISLDDPFSSKAWDQTVDISLNWPGTPEPVQNVVFDDLIAWTYCYGFKIGQGMRQNQSGITFRNGVVYNASVGFGIDHKYGAGVLSNVTFENIDIEQIGTWLGPLRTWTDFVIVGADGFGGGPMDTLTVRNIQVRDKGQSTARLKGFSSTAMIRNATFDRIYMPGSAVPAQNLYEMNIVNRAFHTPVTILPVQTPEPVQRLNLAAGKPATASSSKADPSLSVDGNLGTRWGSNYTDAEWYSVDLGSSMTIDQVKIYWEAAYGKSYQIQVSEDGTSWRTVYSTTTGDGGVDEIYFAPQKARYIKMNGTQRGTVYGYSMWELEVYGDSRNLAAGAIVSGTSSLENSNWSYTKAVDGQRSSVPGAMGWTSNNSLTENHTESVTLDLGSVKTVDQVDLYPRNDAGNIGQNFPVDFTIQTSGDNTTWTTRIRQTGYAQPGNSVQSFTFPAVSARFIKIEGTNLRPNPADGDRYRMAFAEIEVFAANLAAGAAVTASSTVQNTNFGTAKLTDGQRSSVAGSYGWTSNNSLTSDHTEHVQLDIGAVKTISQVDIYPRNDAGNIGQNFPVDFTIQTSADNVVWVTYVARTGYAQPGNAVQSFTFPAASARYVKVEGTKLRPNPADGNRYRMAFAEIELYGVDNLPPATYAAAEGTEGKDGWFVSSVSLALTAEDSLSGIGTTFVKIDGEDWRSYAEPIVLGDGKHEVHYYSIDRSGNAEETKSMQIFVDSTPPVLNPQVSPAVAEIGSTFTAEPGASDQLSGIAVTECGQPESLQVGIHSVKCTAEDKAGNTAEKAASYQVMFPFSGFKAPVQDVSVVQEVYAGSAVPIKFSLGGDRGMDISIAGYPASVDAADPEQELLSVDADLEYDPNEDQYILIWKTDKAWAGTTRKLIMKLIDGTEHSLLFTFK
ncbi:discoidin domain-containing protein [Paenibacillus beijingensis]|uniref:discoidin domain-containing protein n=1 Tax=Paenibacillus beijingensis TaxID=1126833 RepID=UPI0006969A68|nr:discoidin domain-containing protein [Paenibacillus beijingensis]